MAVEVERPKVLVPEKVSPDGLALLQKTLEVHEKKGLSPEQLLEIIGESHHRSEYGSAADYYQAIMKHSLSDPRQKSPKSCSKLRRNSRL